MEKYELSEEISIIKKKSSNPFDSDFRIVLHKGEILSYEIISRKNLKLLLKFLTEK